MSLGSVDLGCAPTGPNHQPQAATKQQGRTPEVQRIGRQRGASFGLAKNVEVAASDLKTVSCLETPKLKVGWFEGVFFYTFGGRNKNTD